MSLTDEEKSIFGENAEIIDRNKERTIYKIGDTDGEVVMTAFPVFEGISIIYNDVHAKSYVIERNRAEGILEVNHCREGRIEYKYGNNSIFLAPGDLSVSRKDMSVGSASFPTGHYHGITVLIDIARAPKCLSCLMEDVEVRPEALLNKFCANEACFAARSSASVEHVFSELYKVPEEIRKGYFKVKILELLLFLSALPVENEQKSYSKTQVKLAKLISEYLMNNTEGRTSIADISAHFGASPSLINNSFRGVYGMTPAAFLRTRKMHEAARLLRETDWTVLDIAGRFGYDNASKFAKAFKDVIGVSPNAYRNGNDTDSCAP